MRRNPNIKPLAFLLWNGVIVAGLLLERVEQRYVGFYMLRMAEMDSTSTESISTLFSRLTYEVLLNYQWGRGFPESGLGLSTV